MKVAALVQRLERQRMLPRAVLATFIVVSFVSIFRMKLVKVVSTNLIFTYSIQRYKNA